jgi:hypothetical protein
VERFSSRDCWRSVPKRRYKRVASMIGTFPICGVYKQFPLRQDRRSRANHSTACRLAFVEEFAIGTSSSCIHKTSCLHLMVFIYRT